MEKFSGKTQSAPILGAAFWKKGVKVSGRYVGKFTTQNGPCYLFVPDKPLKVNGAEISPAQNGEVSLPAYSVGNMKGFENAVEISGCGEFKPNDKVTIEATGTQDTGQASPMVTFNLDVERS
jgi:hypothetical protein